MANTLPRKYFLNKDVNFLAKNLIGKSLHTRFNGVHTAGVILETEAYCGLTDKACHAYNNKRTSRTKVFFEKGGISYVYKCYGIHDLFNIITGPKEYPQAILIRSIKSIKNVEEIQKRRGKGIKEKNLTNGPGKLTEALGISIKHNKLVLKEENKIWIEDGIFQGEIIQTPRIGIGEFAKEDAKLPWRYLAI